MWLDERATNLRRYFGGKDGELFLFPVAISIYFIRELCREFLLIVVNLSFLSRLQYFPDPHIP